MRRHNLALWCCTLLFVASSELQENFTTTIDNAWNNSTVRYEIHDDTITTNRSNGAELIRYDVREKSTKNNDHVQYEFRANSTSNNREDNNSMQNEFRIHSTRKDHEGGNQMPIELRANSTEVDDKNNFTLHKLHENSTQIEDRSNLTYKTEKFYADNNEKNACEDTVCIPLCCPYGSRMKMEKCKAAKSGNYIFPDVYEYATNNSLERKPIGQKLDELFQLIIYNPCLPHQDRYVLEPKTFSQDDYMFLINGSLYRPPQGTFVESYCLALLKQDTYQVAICFNDDDETVLEEQDEYQQNLYPVGLVVSLPFLLATFVVYSILPELRNMHGYTLRAYVGSMFIAYTSLAIIQLSHPDTIPDSGCIALGTACLYNNIVNTVYVRLNGVYSCVDTLSLSFSPII